MKRIDTSSSYLSNNGLIYQSEEINLFVELSDFSAIVEEPFVLDGLAVVLISEGHASIEVEDARYKLEEGTILITSPHTFINNILMSMDIKVSGSFVSTEFLCKIAKDIHFDFSSLSSNRIFVSKALNERDKMLFTKEIEVLSLLYNRGNNGSNALSITAMFHSFGLLLSELLKSDDGASKMSPMVNNSADGKVCAFLEMISMQHSDFLNVEGYAQRLCISPKYFSNICKKVTGRTAGSIINEHIIREAKLQLANPELPIKHIAYRLGFVNPSHFGTFMRRKTGMSPIEIRNRYLKDCR